MNVLLDAHLPRRLVAVFRAAGHDAIHTLDLPDGNATSDAEIPAVIAVECGTTWTWVTWASVGQKAFRSLSAITTPHARCQQGRNFRTCPGRETAYTTQEYPTTMLYNAVCGHLCPRWSQSRALTP